MSGAETTQVLLHVYDLSNGLCAALSTQLLGRHFEAIYHTGVVAFGTEWFFGGGIFHDTPGQTHYGTPMRVVAMGSSAVDHATFQMFLDGIRPRFRMQDYDLVAHNCNNFSQELVQFLTGRSIPPEILALPAQLLSTPLGASLRPMLDAQQQRMTEFYATQGGQANPLAALAQPPLSVATAPSTPASGFVLFTVQKSTDRVIAKLREFVAGVALSDAERAALARLSPDAVGAALAADVAVPLTTLTRKLAVGKRFPALDLLRVLLAHESAAVAVRANAPAAADLLAVLNEPPTADAAANRMALRCVANLFNCGAGRALVLAADDGARECEGGVALQATCRALEHLTDEQTALGAASCAFNLSHFITPDARNADVVPPLGVALSDDSQTQLCAAVTAALCSVSPQSKAVPILLSTLLQIVQHNTAHADFVRLLDFDVTRFSSFQEAQTLHAILSKTTA
jgi:hypothetical protein